jgi:hypothetical protein
MLIKGLDNTNLGILWTILQGKFVGKIKLNGSDLTMTSGRVDLGSLVTPTSLSTTLADYVLKSQIKTVSGNSDTDVMSQKATTDFVNSSINSASAFYLTKNAAGDPFATKAELTAATEFYYAGELRTPTKNDYLLVNADETHDGGACRYVYQGESGQGTWAFQYLVNEAPFTSAQLAALNSGITSALVTQIGTLDTNKADKVANATNGNLAGLDANGNLTDSGIAASDVQTKQTTLAGYGITDASINTSTRVITLGSNTIEVPDWQALTQQELEAIFQ